MQRPLLKLACFLFILPLLLMLFGCSSAKSTPNPDLMWKVDLQKFEMKDKLEGVEIVKQYVGTTEEVHQQYPDEGNVYLIMKVNVSKQGSEPTPFDWSALTVQDEEGNAYQRSSNDTFLEQFDYTPRITALEIKLGTNEGWLCYEIPEQAANGKLTLIYNAVGSQQEIAVKK